MEEKKTAQDEKLKMLFSPLARLEQDAHPGNTTKMLLPIRKKNQSEEGQHADK